MTQSKSKKARKKKPKSVLALSREEKLSLLEVLTEKERRVRNQKGNYIPNAGQQQVHKSAAGVRVVTAGNGGGKTTLAVQEIIASATGYNPWLDKFTPVPTTNIVVLDNPDKVEKLWLPVLSQWYNIDPKWCNKLGRHHVMQIVLPNGSDINFYFHQQDMLVFESIEVDGLVVFDEPPPRHCWVGLRRGGRVKGRKTRYLFVGTAIARAWIRKELIEPSMRNEINDVDVFKFKSEVNKDNLSEGYLEGFASILSDKEKRIRLDGEYFDLSGLALAHLFDRTIHVVEPFEIPAEWPAIVAVDPHPSKAHHAILMVSDDRGQLYVVDEMAEKSVAKEFAISLTKFMAGSHIVDIVSDSLGSSDMTGGEGFYSFIQVLQRYGIKIRPTTYSDKNDEAFIERIQSALYIPKEADNFGQTIPKLRIFKNCTGTINDIENVQWQKQKTVDENKPKLDIAHKDYLSCLKYGLATHLNPDKGKIKSYMYKDPAATYGLTQQGPKVDKAGTIRLGSALGKKRITLKQWMCDEDDDW